MDLNSVLYPLIGGGLIGISATLMLLFNGRVTGISGIIASSLSKPSKEGLWRWTFLGGMIVGGFVMNILHPNFFVNASARGIPIVGLAGLLVGYGTVMGSGCTSGHGVCGIARFSMRSIIATVTFIFFGFLAVQATRLFMGGVL